MPTTSTTAAPDPAPPAEPPFLADAGTKLWTAIAVEFDLLPTELRVLEDACREADLVDRLEAALRDADLVVVGSKGQPVPSPILSELRQHRTVLATLLRQLRVTDADPAETAANTSAQARAAAHARWSRRPSSSLRPTA